MGYLHTLGPRPPEMITQLEKVFTSYNIFVLLTIQLATVQFVMEQFIPWHYFAVCQENFHMCLWKIGNIYHSILDTLSQLVFMEQHATWHRPEQNFPSGGVGYDHSCRSLSKRQKRDTKYTQECSHERAIRKSYPSFTFFG